MEKVAINAMMDTTTLVVGQNVYMVSGPMGCEGKVVKVSPEGVEVQTVDRPYLLLFDSNGMNSV